MVIKYAFRRADDGEFALVQFHLCRDVRICRCTGAGVGCWGRLCTLFALFEGRRKSATARLQCLRGNSVAVRIFIVPPTVWDTGRRGRIG